MLKPVEFTAAEGTNFMLVYQVGERQVCIDDQGGPIDSEEELLESRPPILSLPLSTESIPPESEDANIGVDPAHRNKIKRLLP